MKRLNDSYSHIESWLRVTRQTKRRLSPAARRSSSRASTRSVSRPCAGGRGEHRRLPRLRLLQHRLQVRQEALDARHRPAVGAGATSRTRSGSCPSATRSGSRWMGPAPRRCCASSVRRRRAPSAFTPARASSCPPARSTPACCCGAAGSGSASRGRALAFNMATPLTAHFDEKPDSYDGLADLALPPHHPDRAGYRDRDLVQPAGDAVALHARVERGPLPQHGRNTTRWRAPALLSGRSPTGTCAAASSATSGSSPSGRTSRSLMSGVKQLAEIFFEAGATRVMPSTYRYRVIQARRRPRSAVRLRGEPNGHLPQLRSPAGRERDQRDRQTRVSSTRPSRCMGSTTSTCATRACFPSSITVNPQYTVMALAHYAASGDQPPGSVKEVPVGPAHSRFRRPAERPSRSELSRHR